MQLASAFTSFFGPAAVPRMARRAYVWELRSALTFSLAMACVEVGVIGVIARKVFDADDLVVTTLTAAPAFAHLAAAFLTHTLTGRDRVRAINIFQLCIIGAIAGMALIPQGGSWVWALVALMIAARVAVTGLYAARTDVWRSNFPRSTRAKITSRITVVMSSVVSAASVCIGLALDRAETDSLGPFHSAGPVFRAVFIACAVASLVGVWAFSHIRWRRGPLTMREERGPTSEHERRLASPLGMLHVLRTDRDFRRYMTAQFVIGVPNLAVMAPFIIAIDERMGLGYTRSFILTTVLPLALPIVAMPFWARLLDHMRIIRFRVYHSWTFVFANVLMGVGIITESYTALLISRAIYGFAFGGGVLAWSLGHHDFAPKRLARVYMGVHVTLTGVRGIVAPFLGTLLYAGVIGFGALRISIPAMGGWAFIALATISIWGALLFFRLDRAVTREKRLRDEAQQTTHPEGPQ